MGEIKRKKNKKARATATLTTHKAIGAHSENAPSLQQLRVGTTGAYKALKVVFCHPLREPFQLAITQKA